MGGRSGGGSRSGRSRKEYGFGAIEGDAASLFQNYDMLWRTEEKMRDAGFTAGREISVSFGTGDNIRTDTFVVLQQTARAPLSPEQNLLVPNYHGPILQQTNNGVRSSAGKLYTGKQLRNLLELDIYDRTIAINFTN